MKRNIFQIIIILLILILIYNYPVLADDDLLNEIHDIETPIVTEVEFEEDIINDNPNPEELEDINEILTEEPEIITTHQELEENIENIIILYDYQPITMEEIQYIIDFYEMAIPEERVKPHWEYEVEDWLMPEGYYCGFEDMDETFPYPYYTFFSYPEMDVTFETTLDEYSIIESISEMSATVDSAESFLKALEDQVDEITLTADITITVSIGPSANPPTSRYDIVKDLTIYGQSHTLSLNYIGTGGNYFRLINSGTLRIYDLTIESTVSHLYNARHLFSVYNPSGGTYSTWDAEFTNVKFTGGGLIGQSYVSGAYGTVENATFYGTTEINVNVETASYNATVYAKSVTFEGTTSLYADYGYYLDKGFIYAANDIVINSDLSVVTTGYGAHGALLYSENGKIYFTGNVDMNINQPNTLTKKPIINAPAVYFHGNQTAITINRQGTNSVAYEHAIVYATDIELGKPDVFNPSDGSIVTINVVADLIVFKSRESASAISTTDISNGSFIINPFTTVNLERDRYYYIGLVSHHSIKSQIEGYTNFYFKNDCNFTANARTSATPTSAIITSMKTNNFIIENNASVTLTSTKFEPAHESGCSAIILKKPDEGTLNFSIDSGGSLDVAAFGTTGSIHGYSPIRILGNEAKLSSLSLTTIYGSLNSSAVSNSGWWYQYNLGAVSGKDIFIVDGGNVNIIADGSYNSVSAEYAAFAHYTKNELEISVINGGYMQIKTNGKRAISLAGSLPPTAYSGLKSINVMGAGSTLEIIGGEYAIAAEANASLSINVLDGGYLYTYNTLNANIYTTGKAVYKVSGEDSELRIIRSGASAGGSTTASWYGAIFHDICTYGPLEIEVTQGGYMYVENSYGTRAAICAQSSSMQNIVRVTGEGSNLTVINNNTKDAIASSIIVDNALYPLGAITFSANTSGNIYVEDGAGFYAESHNPFSPTIALGGYGPHHPIDTRSGAVYLRNPGFVDIRNDSETNGDIRATAIRGRAYHDPGHNLHIVATTFNNVFLENTQLTLSVENCNITVYRTNGSQGTSSFVDWSPDTIIRSWKNTTFNTGNIQTIYNVLNSDGSNSINGASAGDTVLNSFSLHTYGRITVGGGFRITYDGNGGETSDNKTQYQTGLYQSDTLHNVMNNSDIGFQMHSSLFMYWNTEPDGSGYSYYPNDTITITEDVTLYAIWIYIENNQFVLPLTGGNGVAMFTCIGVVSMGVSILCAILGLRNRKYYIVNKRYNQIHKETLKINGRQKNENEKV